MQQANANSLKLLRFNAFSPTHGVIEIPVNSIFARGRNKENVAMSGTYPLYLTSEFEVAESYAKGHGNKGVVTWYRSVRPIKVYDLRYIRLLILDFLSSPASSPIANPLQFKRAAQFLKCAYGACTLVQQVKTAEHVVYRSILKEENDASNTRKVPGEVTKAIKALKEFYADSENNWDTGICACDPIEPLGTRIGETNLDAQTVLFLSEMFNAKVDGYIAPDMCAPFQIHRQGRIHSELVIFEPDESILHVMDDHQVQSLRATSVDIKHILEDRLSKMSVNFLGREVTFHVQDDQAQVQRGGKKHINKIPLYDPNAWFESVQPERIARIRQVAKEFSTVLDENVSKQSGGGWRPTKFKIDPIIDLDL